MRYIKILLIFLMITSCIPSLYKYSDNLFDIGREYSIKLGYPIVEWEAGYKNDDYTYAIRKELIYAGLNRNILKLVYREYFLEKVKDKPYKSLLAREPFRINLTYDLNLSKIIAYQDLKIRILSASNEQIKFIVLKAPKEFYNRPTPQTQTYIDDGFDD